MEGGAEAEVSYFDWKRKLQMVTDSREYLLLLVGVMWKMMEHLLNV